ncbi:LAGLIDADG family homing endonuclease [Candidatus Giovannonibacteria bacterium]|nr:LAGLIDADG family homing endonuclease [Candidatus Giovannonibacteria bacterium]
MAIQNTHKEYYDRLSNLQGKYLNYFVAGFVDGESSFSVAMTRQKYSSLLKGWRWILNPVFNVYQHENNKDILLLLKNVVFKTGRIHRKTSPYNVFTFTIENNKTLHEKIVPFFNKYQLATKTEDFKKFSRIVDMMERKTHLDIEGFKRIVDIAFTMNAQGKNRKYSKEYVFETLSDQFNTLIKSPETIRQNQFVKADKI